MRPPITQKSLKTIFCSLKTNIQTDCVLLRRRRSAVQNARNRVRSCEIENDNFTDSQGKQIRTENRESVESEVLKQKQHCVTVAVPSWFRKLPNIESTPIIFMNSRLYTVKIRI